jgi:hypothetical protein
MRYPVLSSAIIFFQLESPLHEFICLATACTICKPNDSCVSANALCREVDIYNNIDIEGTRLGSETSHTRTDLTA